MLTNKEMNLKKLKARVKEISPYYYEDLKRYLEKYSEHGSFKPLLVPIVLDETSNSNLMVAVDNLLFELGYDFEWKNLTNSNYVQLLIWII